MAHPDRNKVSRMSIKMELDHLERKAEKIEEKILSDKTSGDSMLRQQGVAEGLKEAVAHLRKEFGLRT